MSLTENEIDRYSRQIILKDIGISGQKKLKKSKVLIIGLGGLGCPAVEYLSRAGVGTIGIVDHDKVSLSNIHRQSIFTSNDIKKYNYSNSIFESKEMYDLIINFYKYGVFGGISKSFMDSKLDISLGIRADEDNFSQGSKIIENIIIILIIGSL